MLPGRDASAVPLRRTELSTPGWTPTVQLSSRAFSRRLQRHLIRTTRAKSCSSVCRVVRTCCQGYGQTRGRNRVLAAAQTIFLYAVLLRRPCRQTRRNAVSSNYTGDIGSGDLPGVAARSSATETIWAGSRRTRTARLRPARCLAASSPNRHGLALLCHGGCPVRLNSASGAAPGFDQPAPYGWRKPSLPPKTW